MAIKLTYFNIPARAEATRLAFMLGKIPFEDQQIESDKWPALKAQTPYGQLPLLTLADGTRMAQSNAILRYVGRMTNLYPQDLREAQRVDEVLYALEDASEQVRNTNSIQDPAEKIKARRALFAAPDGRIYGILHTLDDLVGQNPHGWVSGSRLSVGDLRLFCWISWITAGSNDGVDLGLFQPHTALLAHRNRVAAIPEIYQRYKNGTDKFYSHFLPTA